MAELGKLLKTNDELVASISDSARQVEGPAM